MTARMWMTALLVCLPAGAETITGYVDATPHKYVGKTVVYLRNAPHSKAPRNHLLDQKGMSFLPEVLAISVRDSVTFQNSDGVDHNVFSADAESYDLGMFPKGAKRVRTFGKPGVYTQQCRMHPEMVAYIFVGPSAYSAVVDRDGTFTIEGVPPGSWTLAIWNPYLKASDQKVTIASGGTASARFELN